MAYLVAFFLYFCKSVISTQDINIFCSPLFFKNTYDKDNFIVCLNKVIYIVRFADVAVMK
jgi:hypothetical protein